MLVRVRTITFWAATVGLSVAMAVLFIRVLSCASFAEPMTLSSAVLSESVVVIPKVCAATLVMAGAAVVWNSAPIAGVLCDVGDAVASTEHCINLTMFEL